MSLRGEWDNVAAVYILSGIGLMAHAAAASSQKTLEGSVCSLIRIKIRMQLMCAFSFMNSKRYKPMLNKRREVSGRACYLCVAAYLLPIRCACALPRSTRRLPLFMELLDRRGATLCSASACL